MQSNSPVAKRKGVVTPFCQNRIPILLHNVHRLFRNIPLGCWGIKYLISLRHDSESASLLERPYRTAQRCVRQQYPHCCATAFRWFRFTHNPTHEATAETAYRLSEGFAAQTFVQPQRTKYPDCGKALLPAPALSMRIWSAASIAIKLSSCSTIVLRSSAKKQVDLTAYRSSPSGARLFLVRINLKNLLSAFELPL